MKPRKLRYQPLIVEKTNTSQLGVTIDFSTSSFVFWEDKHFCSPVVLFLRLHLIRNLDSFSLFLNVHKTSLCAIFLTVRPWHRDLFSVLGEVQRIVNATFQMGVGYFVSFFYYFFFVWEEGIHSNFTVKVFFLNSR